MAVLEYFKRKPAKQAAKAEQATGMKSPVLTDEDEAFLEKLAAEAPAPAIPDEAVVILDNGTKVTGKDAQVALMDGADAVPLPTSPPAVAEDSAKGRPSLDAGAKQKRKSFMGYFPAMPNLAFIPVGKKGKGKAGADLHDAAQQMKAGGVPAEDESQRKAEEQELTGILDNLNLLAVNNRAFSFSKESQKLLEEFTQVLKDIVNGVPTAYDDLEQLLTRSEKQLRETMSNLPPFLQTLVKSLPAKMTAGLAPELLAGASEKPGADAKTLGINTLLKKKARARIPSLRTLLATEGAAAGMLRSILQFLKLRFPAFISGTSVLMSMAVFLLLLVFYYCWKRGRETRLANEAAASGEASEVEMTESEMGDSTLLDNPVASPSQAAESSRRAETLEAALNKPDPKDVPLPAESLSKP